MAICLAPFLTLKNTAALNIYVSICMDTEFHFS
jgi:hypothetical protein